MTDLHSSWVLYDSVFVPDSDISDSHWRSGGWWLAENQTVRKYKPNTQTNCVSLSDSKWAKPNHKFGEIVIS